MIGINDEGFNDKFLIDQGVVGQIGNGFIGNAVVQLFKPFCTVLTYDKYRTDLSNASLHDLVKLAQVIFIAVPTPMEANGDCHTKIVESVLKDIQDAAVDLQRDPKEFVVVIKSTIPPGFTREMQNRHFLRILFSPEFLTEANAVSDFKNARRLILGGNIEDAMVVFRYFQEVWHDRMPESDGSYNGANPAGPVFILQCEPEIAELVKLATNAFLATKVHFFNEISLMCQKLNIKYDEVKDLMLLDWRIGRSHTTVPGPDGKLGFSGSCFPKDVGHVAALAHKLETGGEQFFDILFQRNIDIRGCRDWEELSGRAVLKEE